MDGGFFSKSEMMQVRAPSLGIPKCGACGLFKQPGCQSPKMPPDGRGRRRVLIAGESPGKGEDNEGIPFVGKTGQHLERVCDGLGFDLRRDAWLTNAVWCHPEGNDLSIQPNAVEYCRPNLLNTIARLKPDVIVLLGGTAVQSLIGHLWKEDTGGISRWVGWQIPCIKTNAYICPTFHPSYLLRMKDPVLDMEFRQHLRAAFKLEGKPHPDGPPDYERQVRVILNSDEAAARVRKFTGGMAAFDFETTTLKPDGPDADIVCCSVCWEGTETISFPWHGPVKRAMVDFLENPDVGKIGANIKFETRYAKAKLGVDIQGWCWDFMLSAHALDPRGGITGLKFQSFALLGVPDYAAHIKPFLEARDKGGNAPNRIREIELTDLLRYCGYDSLWEYLGAMIQMKKLGVG